MGIRYGEQLERKRLRVRHSIERLAPSLDVEVARPIGSQRVFGYRNQVKLVARRSERGLVLGVYKPGTHEVVDASHCSVHDQLVQRALEVVGGAVEREQVPIYDEDERTGWLRYVAVRSSWMRRTTQVVLVVRDRSWRGEAKLIRRLRESRGVGSVVLNENDTKGNTIFGQTFVPMTRYDALVERVGVLQLKFHAGSFVQANLSAARRAYETVTKLAAASGEDTVVDLFCGVGAISLLLGVSAANVFGIESSESSILDARENTRINGFHNVRFRVAGALEGLRQLRAELPKIDVVTLNPPRKGATSELLDEIVGAAPRRIVYMSCDPDTLARDLEALAHSGYRTTTVQPFDFLPQTEHIETVALVTRS